ncbi:MAG: DsrE family protein [Rhodospirillaceae bacterium]|jgi:sulfur relay (sulfurtransferase) complex TusBCD TusD component (DsrE family)|nr:DsrE family protein [Rhodospirillaceae bacterium]MBT7138234.1 DsrE family protein [Rhodospirillaceae bacterium]
MKHLKHTAIALSITLALLVSFNPSVTHAADAKAGLFVNLTTDDTWAATKAIMFAHKKALKNGLQPVAIWLNVRGIYLADKKRPSHTHGLMKANVQQMLQAFIKDGGTVYACQACSKAAGLTPDSFIDGVKMGNEKAIVGLIADPNVKTLSW